MSRTQRLTAAAERWYARADGLSDVVAWRLARPLLVNSLTRRLWCLKHARRCTFLALRAYREAQRLERLAMVRNGG